MTEEEIIRELCERAVKLADLQVGPIPIFATHGHRSFEFGAWQFDLRCYTPEHWSFSGPKCGDVRSLQICLAANAREYLFYFSVDVPTHTHVNYESCESLVIALRHSMILDDLAAISPSEAPGVDAEPDRF